MKQQGRRAALGIALAVMGIALAVMVLGDRSDATQPRTPIDVASLGPQVGEQVPEFSLPDQNGQSKPSAPFWGPRGRSCCFTARPTGDRIAKRSSWSCKTG